LTPTLTRRIASLSGYCHLQLAIALGVSAPRIGPDDHLDWLSLGQDQLRLDDAVECFNGSYQICPRSGKRSVPLCMHPGPDVRLLLLLIIVSLFLFFLGITSTRARTISQLVAGSRLQRRRTTGTDSTSDAHLREQPAPTTKIPRAHRDALPAARPPQLRARRVDHYARTRPPPPTYRRSPVPPASTYRQKPRPLVGHERANLSPPRSSPPTTAAHAAGQLSHLVAVPDTAAHYSDANRLHPCLRSADRAGQCPSCPTSESVLPRVRYEMLRPSPRALTIAREIDDRLRQGDHGNLAIATNVRPARGRHRPPAQPSQSHGAQRRRCWHRAGNLAHLWHLGRYEEALDRASHALAIARKTGDRPSVAPRSELERSIRD